MTIPSRRPRGLLARQLTKGAATLLPPVRRVFDERDGLRTSCKSLEASLAEVRAQFEQTEVTYQAEIARAQAERQEMQAHYDAKLAALDGQLEEVQRLNLSLQKRLEADQRIFDEFGRAYLGTASSIPRDTIFFATLPKSGTEFLWHGIREATGLDMSESMFDENFMRGYLSGYCNREDVASTGLFTSERLSLKGIRQFLPSGYVLGAHAPATYHNIRVLQDAWIRHVTVLVRDPRDATVSWTHHVRAIGSNMRNFNSLAQHVPADYFNWPDDRQLAFQVRTFLPAAVNWIESWLGAVAESMSAPAILIVYFDELRRDPRRFFETMLTFHEQHDFDVSRIAEPTPGARHFRKGEHGQWREEFSRRDRTFADNLIGDRLIRAFAKAADRHPNLALAREAETSGDDEAAALNYLAVLRRFSTCGPARDGLARILSNRGIEMQLPLEDADPFIIPEAALADIEGALKARRRAMA